MRPNLRSPRPPLGRPNGRPQIVAHRGASASRAEHTLAAYLQALEDGAEGLECDVRLTADGHLVCVHDRRVNRTSNGRGLVSTLELDDLDKFDWSSWKVDWKEPSSPQDDISLAQSKGVLTLRKLLDAVGGWESPVELAIETKHPTRYAGLVERTLVALLDEYGLTQHDPRRGSKVRIMSFSWISLRRCLELAPGLPMVYLMDRVPLRFRDGSLPLGATIAGPSIETIRAHPEYVAKAHAAGHEVHVWTVNEPADVALCADLGVDALITDDPATALATFASG